MGGPFFFRAGGGIMGGRNTCFSPGYPFSIINAFIPLVLSLALLAGPLLAETRAELIAVIEAAGHNETDQERNRVEIAGCTMTTYRWRNVPDKGWILWTSFLIPMPDVMFVEDKKNAGSFFSAIELVERDDLVIIQFEARDGVEVRHEKSVLRKSKRETSPSPRGDGTTHFFEYKDRFFIIQEGADVIEKARIFTEGYRRYVQDFCTFIG